MAVRRRARASDLAARVACVAIATAGCQRTPPAASAVSPPAVVAERSQARAPQDPIDAQIAALEEQTGARLSLDLMAHEEGSIYPAWLPDNRLVVPGEHGASIVDPRSGSTISVPGKGRRAIVSPDGKIMAIASSSAVELVEVASGQSVMTGRAVIDDSDDKAIQFSPDGRLFAYRARPDEQTGGGVGGDGGDDAPPVAISIYDVVTRAHLGSLVNRGFERRRQGLTAKYTGTPDPNDALRSFELRSDRVVASFASGATSLWDARSRELLLAIASAGESGSTEHRPTLTQDGTLAVVWGAADLARSRAKTAATAGSNDKNGPAAMHAERRWVPLLVDARSGEVLMRLEDRQCAAFGFAMHPHRPLLAVGSLYPGYCLWDLAERKVKQRARIAATTKDTAGAGLVLRLAAKMSPKMDLPIDRLAFDATGERIHLGIAHLGGVVVRLSDGAVSEGAMSKDARPGDFAAGAALATSPDRSMIAGSGSEARVWEVASGRVLRRMAQHDKHALLSWTEQGLTIVGNEGSLVRFRSATGELAERRTLAAGFDEMKAVATGEGGFLIASSHLSGLRAARMDAPGTMISLAWPDALDGVLAAAASARGNRLAVAASDRIVVFDAQAGQALGAFVPRAGAPQESGAPIAVALDDDGQFLAAIVGDSPRVWEVTSRREIQLSPGDCTAVKFEPKSSLVVAACRDQVRAWDPRTGAAIATAESSDLSEGVFFDGSGARFAQLGMKYLTLRDGRTLAEQGRTETDGPTSTAVFSPKGRVVAVALKNGEGVEFYRAADGKRLARLRLWPNDEAWIARSDEGKVELAGDTAQAEKDLACRVGREGREFPLQVCVERLVVKGLLRDILSERVGAP